MLLLYKMILFAENQHQGSGIYREL